MNEPTAMSCPPTGRESDLANLAASVAQLSKNVSELARADAARKDLFEEFTPIAREIMAHLTTRLDDAERRGYFALGRAALEVVERVADHYGPDDVRLLGENVVAILDTVRRVTQPDILGVVRDVTEAVAGDTAPVGLYGMMKATRDDDVRHGFGVLVALLKQLGRSTRKLASPPPTRSLAAMLGPRRGAPRALPPAEPYHPAAPAKPPPIPARAVTGADACGILSNQPATARDEAWTHEGALAEAGRLGIALSDAHWALIDWARHEQSESGTSPNIRRLSVGTDVPIKELYALFPKAPAKTIAILAGIPKPAGCI